MLKRTSTTVRGTAVLSLFGDVLIALFVTVAGVMAYQLLTGKIYTHGLLRESASGPIQPERVQLLVVTVAAMAIYVATAVTHPAGMRLPEPQNVLIASFGGSHGIYVVGKLIRRLSGGLVP